MEILNECDPNVYPNKNFLLKMLATLPVSTIEIEPQNKLND